MNILVRKATIEDADEIAKVHVETWKSSYGEILPRVLLESLSIGDRLKKWQLWLNDNSANKYFVVGCVDGKIMGIGGFCVLPDDENFKRTGEMEMLYIHSNAQNKGLGRKIMKHGLSFLNNSGCKEVVSWVFNDNKKARNFYEHMGWVDDNFSKIKVKNGFNLQMVRYSTKLREIP